jgi:DNA-binding transcriptional LysR family regulator
MLPTFLAAADLNAGRLEPVLQDWCEAEAGGIHAVFPASRNLSPKVRVFVDFLAKRFGGEPDWDPAGG